MIFAVSHTGQDREAVRLKRTWFSVIGSLFTDRWPSLIIGLTLSGILVGAMAADDGVVAGVSAVALVAFGVRSAAQHRLVITVDHAWFLVMSGGLGLRMRCIQQVPMARVERARHARAGTNGYRDAIEFVLVTGERLPVRGSRLLGFQRRNQWLDVIDGRLPGGDSSAPTCVTEVESRQRSEIPSFWLQDRRVRRAAIRTVTTFQTVIYAIGLWMILGGLGLVFDRNGAGGGWIAGRGVLLLFSVPMIAGVAQLTVRPKVRIVPSAAAIEIRRAPIPMVISYDELQNLTLWTNGFGIGMCGPLTDRSGIKQPQMTLRLGLGGPIRMDGDEHPLSHWLPPELAGLNNNIEVVDRYGFADALKLALYVGIGPAWHAGRMSLAPERERAATSLDGSTVRRRSRSAWPPEDR